ncbi:MAG: ribonuclease Z [Candidatus Lokiarchaeota archaeon]
MKVIFLGTNGWYATKNGNTTCTLLDSESYYVIFDAGDGIYKLDKYIREEKPIFIFLSHLHFDHIIGIHILTKFRFQQKIYIYGAHGTKSYLNEIIKHPFTVPFQDLPSTVEIHDLNAQTSNLPFSLVYLPLKHSDYCLGYRINLEGKVITYATDTGLCENLYNISDQADLFITECSYKKGQEKWGWPHLKPEEAAVVAQKSKCDLLVFSHFDPSIFKSRKDREKVEVKTQKIFQKTRIAEDGLIIEL